jgi:hypothetical protein
VQETHLLSFKKSFIEAKSSSLRMDISRALSHFTYKLGLLKRSGDYQTNLISDNGTGEKLELIIGKYIQVKHNTVAGIYFKVDGKIILGAKFKNYKLTWDYGTNMQPNDNKGSITFSEVFLDGKT